MCCFDNNKVKRSDLDMQVQSKSQCELLILITMSSQKSCQNHLYIVEKLLKCIFRNLKKKMGFIFCTLMILHLHDNLIKELLRNYINSIRVVQALLLY